MKTIFAQSSGYGKCGVSLFRISGEKAAEILKKLTLNCISDIIPRHMYYSKIYDPSKNLLIDHAMVVYFKGPSSFTGEDVVEIYTHGSIAITKMLTSTLLSMDNTRLAEPGEFARRAFLNNKFDLTAAEGLADLIEAETIMQHKQAMNQMEGELHKLYDNWRSLLLKTISLLEAYIDFPDEEIPNQVLDEVNVTIEKLITQMQDHLNDNKRGQLLRDGIKLAIIGDANVGKSSLINKLVKNEISIVSNIPGTTRDVVERHLDIDGFPIILQDTAGIRDIKDNNVNLIEQEGIKRSIKVMKNADIKIIVIDIKNPCIINDIKNFIDKNTIIVINKIDLINDIEYQDIESKLYQQINNHNLLDNDVVLSREIFINNIVYISAKQNLHIDKLLDKISSIANLLAYINEESPVITRERHRYQMSCALDNLKEFNLSNELILATENIRLAIRSLSNITGKITVDEILGEIFSNFCIGK